MQPIRSLTTILLLLVAASSCKKNDIQAPVTENNPKLIRIEQVGGSNHKVFTYNQQGRLAEANTGYFTMKYNYTTGPFACEIFDITGAKRYDIVNTVSTGDRISYFLYRGLSASGTVNWADTTTVQYDANGFQVEKKYRPYQYQLEIVDGNTTKMTSLNTATGNVSYSQTAEYYADKPNKLNLNIFENYNLDQPLSDHEVFGKRSRNLPKKITRNSSGGTNSVSEYSYVTDANGKITSYTVTYATNGGTPVTESYNLYYQ